MACGPKADPAWEWVRVLIFLAQSALVAQGHDLGKPDGIMGLNTMMALLRWHADSGESKEIGLVTAVAYLLHATLEAKGLAPGPRAVSGLAVESGPSIGGAELQPFI